MFENHQQQRHRHHRRAPDRAAPGQACGRAGSSGKQLRDSNPHDGSAVAEFTVADSTDIDRAYLAAKENQHAWGKTNAYRLRRLRGRRELRGHGRRGGRLPGPRHRTLSFLFRVMSRRA
ncbi:aldehyde dehydrogenase family protein [Amycolatopsis sp. NPDC050768]|uniref:aldehyde dehydrogenase family protein n=1 Tax=Amycolatopsis sp. NPDC050768 TaxID=3154839 RepID=UPI001C6A25B9|nr:aldehyde dehydrogenase family protein [Amycolatopsis sp. DSM 110486]